MKYWVLLILLLLAVTVSAKTFVPVKSIQPLVRVNDDGEKVNVCTAFSINETRGLWLTANHCYAGGEQFAGSDVEWVGYNEKYDLAVFQGPHVTALVLAIKAPEVGDEVVLSGYPHGSLDLITFFGRTSAVKARVMPTYTGSVFNILGLPGDSGSPILDNSGRVVGVAQVSSQNGVVWGADWFVLKEQLTRFVE